MVWAEVVADAALLGAAAEETAVAVEEQELTVVAVAERSVAV